MPWDKLMLLYTVWDKTANFKIFQIVKKELPQ
jgi:hypothetical protein